MAPGTRHQVTARLLIIAFLLVPVFWCLLPLFVHADVPIRNCAIDPRSCAAFIPLAQTPSGKLANIYSNTGDIGQFINSVFLFAIALGAIAAVLRLAYAGYLYMGQADMWSHKGEAKAIIGDVTLGLLLLLGIWLILNQINPYILNLNALQTIKNHPTQQSQSANYSFDPNCHTGYADNGACLPQAAPSAQEQQVMNLYNSPNYDGSGVNPFTNGGGSPGP